MSETNSNNKKSLLIVDGSHYLYRAYYGVPVSARLPSGLQVNAVYGFMAYLRKAVDILTPSSVIVIFDSETGIKQKVSENQNYKSNRDYRDNGMYEQLPIIKKILNYLHIEHVEPPNYEADDYIGSLTKHFSSIEGFVYIFSNDADFLQLIAPNIYVVKMGRKGPEVIDPMVFEKTYQFKCENYIDYLALKGDKSDNIAGVKGIGHKSAQYLIRNYKNIENIYSKKESIEKTRVRNLLEGTEFKVKKNKKFLEINCKASLCKKHLKQIREPSFDDLIKSSNYLMNKVGIRTK